jgi:AAA15 family ATPase/GTPase
MIDKIKIQNFKSIVDLEMDLGRINIIIGANGCGKTNILEGITFASAASQHKLDNEFLGTRLRNVPTPFMFSAFDDTEEKDIISITIDEEYKTVYSLKNEGGKWTIGLKIHGLLNDYSSENIELVKENLSYLLQKYGGKTVSAEDLNMTPEVFNLTAKMLGYNPNSTLKDFMIYAPEETKLRMFSDESYILPFGKRGEGLFQHLKQLAENKNKETIEAINEGLYLLDWFDGFSIPNDLLTNEYKLTIGDRFLKESLHRFDQRSTNEGFLYLLFYLTLFNSKEAPSFFAIDNIETSFNPKLNTKLIKYLIGVTKKNNKQVILTTHNPYVLDGLDLSDDEQRLFVARRDIDGHTRIERIPYRENRNMQLSDLWMNGLIGGLPDNF